MQLKYIVDDYIGRFREPVRNEMKWYSDQPSLEAAIEKAALAITEDNRRQPHQWRFQQSTLEQACDSLLRIKSTINRADNFDELHLLVEKAVSPIKGIGELYIYDVAHRIGAKLGLMPTKTYLHRGARRGARALGLLGKGPLKPSELPNEFRRLSAYEIEDVLCIYKDDFDTDEKAPEKRNSKLGCPKRPAVSTKRTRPCGFRAVL